MLLSNNWTTCHRCFRRIQTIERDQHHYETVSGKYGNLFRKENYTEYLTRSRVEFDDEGDSIWRTSEIDS